MYHAISSGMLFAQYLVLVQAIKNVLMHKNVLRRVYKSFIVIPGG
jgi:hypothetical protein